MIILKDKKDIKFAPDTFLNDYEWESHGQYDSLDFINPNVKVLSVQFSKVGEKSYKAFPNLEWIIVRQHGFDNVNLEECEKRNIGVVNTRPFSQSTANWINQYIRPNDNVAIVGYGDIGSKVEAVNYKVFKRSDSIDNLSEFNTLVVAVQPEGNDNLINDSVLKNFKGKLISVSRSNVIDNYALHENIDNITHAYVDTLDSNLREELLETKKVTYTKHTAFEYNFTYENNTQYFINLQNTIDKCLDNNIDNAILSRGERVLF